MQYSKWIKIRDKKIRTLYREGKSLPDIKKVVGVSDELILKVLKRARVAKYKTLDTWLRRWNRHERRFILMDGMVRKELLDKERH